MQAPGGVWQDGCLVRTCTSGTVEESLAHQCVELIEKKVGKILGGKLAQKGCPDFVTKVTINLVYVQVLSAQLKIEDFLRMVNIFTNIAIHHY